jgi:transposase
MDNATYAMGLAKKVFQVHWVEPPTGEIKRKPLARAEVRSFLPAGSRG